MIAYLVGRAVSLASVMALVGVLAFVIVRILPGDPAAMMLGDTATAADIAKLRISLGLDESMTQQFLAYAKATLSGDLGRSLMLNEPVLDAILERSRLTCVLTLMAIAISMAIGIPLGILAAWNSSTSTDRAISAFATLLAGVPTFWIGLTLINVMSIKLQLTPVAGFGPSKATYYDRLFHLILPAVTLGLANSALLMRFTRASFVEILTQDYIRTAWAKGMSPLTVIRTHALRNAGVAILAIVGLTLTSLIGGAVVTETVFALPGIGSLVVQAVLNRDYPLIQGVLIFIAAVYVLINLTIDFCYTLVDPRIGEI